MEKSILVITEKMQERLRLLVARKGTPRVPKNLIEHRPKVVLVGKATKEQQAIALLYSEVMADHDKMHARTGLPFGVHPNVGPVHYQNHVMMSLLYEMFMWSVHRNFRRKTAGLILRFDSKWNMYASVPPPVRKRRKKNTV